MYVNRFKYKLVDILLLEIKKENLVSFFMDMKSNILY